MSGTHNRNEKQYDESQCVFKPDQSFPTSGGFQKIGQWVVVFLFSALIGCSTANLLSEDRRQEWGPLASQKTIPQLRQEVLREIDPFSRYRQGTIMQVTASDIWNSKLVRWMTPLDQDRQQFQACLYLFHNGIEFTFLNGGKKGQTIGFDGQSYVYDAAARRYQKSAGSALYLGPLQSYLEWGQTLIRNPTAALLGKRVINDIPYWIVYATEGFTESLDQYDQYLIYINTRNSRVDYIEFTMRDLMKSYSGVVHYKNHTMIQGILVPFWIGIANNLVQPHFDHYFELESVAFRFADKPLPALSE